MPDPVILFEVKKNSQIFSGVVFISTESFITNCLNNPICSPSNYYDFPPSSSVNEHITGKRARSISTLIILLIVNLFLLGCVLNREMDETEIV